MASFTVQYLQEAVSILNQIDPAVIDKTADLINSVRSRSGRIFFLGVGGGAGHASHAVNDFRKICGIECYTPSDNVSELTARINDEGWETCYMNWLKGSKLAAKDMIFVFSVGGGNREKNVSANLVRALEYAKETGAAIAGVVGRDGGFTAQAANVCVIIPTAAPERITAHTEAFQAVVWHLLVAHPKLQQNEMKWESVKA